MKKKIAIAAQPTVRSVDSINRQRSGYVSRYFLILVGSK